MIVVAVLDPAAPRLAAALAERGVVPAVVATRTEELVGRVDRVEVLLAAPDLAAAAARTLPALRWIQSTWAGVEPLVGAGLPADLAVTRAEGIFGAQMREYVLGHLLAAAQGHDRFRLAQARHEWDPEPPGLLRGATLGVFGTGSIGAAVAGAARALGMRPVGCSRRGRPVPAFDRVVAVDRRVAFAAGVDHLVAALPATTATTRLVDAAVLGALRPGAVFVNVGRGSTVDTAAVVAALRSGILARAILDVFEEEPLPADDPLWSEPGVVVTPHVAAVTRPADLAALFADNLERFGAGRPLRGVVDPASGY